MHKNLVFTMNTFGQNWTFTSFGESHGAAIGGVLDGVPAGLTIDLDLIRSELDRRAGRTVTHLSGASPRAKHEPDEVEWLSGVITNDLTVSPSNGETLDGRGTNNLTVSPSNGETLDGRGTNNQSPITNAHLVTLGTPIAFLIRNRDARPEDYEWLKSSFRVGHADRTYQQKYGIRDWRGGGRASARETAARVVAGCIARQSLAARGITIRAELVQVGAETDPAKFIETITRYQHEGDSIGGIITCTVSGLPVGTGEPIFHKLQAELAFAIMSINACKGFEYGTGFGGVTQPGSAINAISGGIAGGISDGTDLFFRCVFKPTPSTKKAMESIANHLTVSPSNGETLDGRGTNNQSLIGRHDACVAVRAVPVVEAMTALCLADLLAVR